jgi:hypothetical protein
MSPAVRIAGARRPVPRQHGQQLSIWTVSDTRANS